MKSIFNKFNNNSNNNNDVKSSQSSASIRSADLSSSSSSAGQQSDSLPAFVSSSSSSSSLSSSNINQMKLTDMAKYEPNLVNLLIDVNYLGYLDVDGKYLQNSTLRWLMAQVKLLELNKRVMFASMEVNVRTNTIYVYKYINNPHLHSPNLNDSPASVVEASVRRSEKQQPNKIELFTHNLLNVFKMTNLSNDPNCFGYFYRSKKRSNGPGESSSFDSSSSSSSSSFSSSFAYQLHVFSSQRSNMVQVLADFQKQAARLHEHAHFQRVFDFRIVSKFKITSDQLNTPNFIENLIDRATTASSSSSKSRSSSTSRLLERQQALADYREQIYLKFDSNKIYFRELDDDDWIGHDFKSVLCFSNSIIYENFFCIAFETLIESNRLIKKDINAFIFYSESSDLIDSVIKEYALSISSKLNNQTMPTSPPSDPTMVRVFNSSSNNSSSSMSSAAASQLFTSSKVEQHTCPQCPMHQFVELCDYLNSLNDDIEQISYILFEKMNYNLSVNDQKFIMDCLSEQNLTFESYENSLERNQLLVGLIHKLCYKKQKNHLLFIFNRKEAISHYLIDDDSNTFSLSNSTTKGGASFISAAEAASKQQQFTKHSRSLYTNLCDVKSLRNEFKKLNTARKRSNTLDSSEIGSIKKILESSLEAEKRNMETKNLFNRRMENHHLIVQERVINTQQKLNKSKQQQQQPQNHHYQNHRYHHQQSAFKSKSSMRRSIFNNTVGSALFLDEFNNSVSASDSRFIRKQTLLPNNLNLLPSLQKQQELSSKLEFIFKRFKSKQDVVQFWKKVISEQILLNKMEKENRRLRQKLLNESQEVQLKFVRENFGYLEITPCLKDVDKIWQQWLLNDEKESIMDLDEIRRTVLKGVPQTKRGEIWIWLKNQYRIRKRKTKATTTTTTTDTIADYRELLKQTTIHQHSILLDLDRTFPTHPNFNKKFGAGQLALFNVLKAYSIMDHEVGYCQGLSFIVGVLLIHVKNDEEEAFELLKFLLVDLNLREQYKPDMMAFQKHMYQFTRLLYDLSNEIYQHFDDHDVSTSLYAAPWFLTLYSSQFQMGFISRVFDFLFAEGSNVLFKVSLSILNIHKPILMTCDSFESIVNQIKTTIPEMSLIECELIINKSFNIELDKLLDSYEIEFNLYSEDFASSSSSQTTTAKTTAANNAGRRTTRQQQQQQQNNHFSCIADEIDSAMICASYQSRLNEQLELENLKLKNQVNDLLNRLSLIEMNRQNHEEAFYKLEHENKQLKCKIQTLELERSSLCTKLKEFTTNSIRK